MQWPLAPQNCLSLGRLNFHFQRQELPESIWVGGRVTEPKTITGQGLKLVCDSLNDRLQLGQIVALRFGASQLRVTPEGPFRVKGPVDVQVLCVTPGERASDAALLQRSSRFSHFLSSTRGLLLRQGLVEVTTPSLVQNPGMEIHLKSLRVDWQLGSRHVPFYLPTSPELHLKQLLVADWTDIFEIRSCFRSDELSPNHEPEFTMLEWYRAYADLSAIQRDVEALVRNFRPEVQFDRVSIPQKFLEILNFQLQPTTPRDDLLDLCRRLSIETGSDDTWDDLFCRLMIEKIEPSLNPDRGIFLFDYPASQAALAKINDRGWADRFEFFWRGLELANAFQELNDPVEQRRRHTAEQALRRQIGAQVYPLDENFLGALRRGLPPTAGIALGLDRLCMAVYGIWNISEVRGFSVTHQLEELP